MNERLIARIARELTAENISYGETKVTFLPLAVIFAGFESAEATSTGMVKFASLFKTRPLSKSKVAAGATEGAVVVIESIVI